ncbi:MAG: hypothetical protein EGQ88_01225 [Prevotellamassilia timonensis]|uniref:hypothetical protein n=1 Tax=Prevotellamassilia timonensis TaxID=1852370 RepID=UPI002053C29E|nr:hypothetical protein [Prevotellamassilia timonensis]DAR30558.1 MAG TPA: hypothetical protein [Caudoviricetes sp.]
MIQIEDKQIFSTDKYLHRIGTDVYFKRCFMLPTDGEKDFEEVDEIPKVKIDIDDRYEQTTRN